MWPHGAPPQGKEAMQLDLGLLKFLVVDDNAHMRRIVRTLLHGLGARETVEAEDGASGLDIFRSQAPDLVITDWVMPIMDGIELVRRIRDPASPSNPFVPIIMLTGYAERRRVFLARDAGVHEFLAKPLSAKSLYDHVANVIVNPRPFIQAKSYFGPDRRRFRNPNWCGPDRRARHGRAIDIDDFVAQSDSSAKSIAL